MLIAAGNLYKQKFLDYASAAEQYKRIILDFPDWEGAHKVYIELATCYERLEQHENTLWVYEQMLEVFPEESQEHQFAKQKLTFPAPVQ